MRRLLVIDTFSQFGHNVFDRILIQKFLDQGFTVDLAMREGYFDVLEPDPALARIALPERYFPTNCGKFSSRYYELRLLWFIKKHVLPGQYDFIVFSSFEEISLYFSGIKGNLILFAHANVAALDYPVKRVFVKAVAKRGRLVVFHESMRQHCEQFGISNVHVVPHGIPPRYAVSKGGDVSTLRSIDPRLGSAYFAHIVFAPSGAKYGDRLLTESISDPEFRRFLEDRRIALVIKDNSFRSECENVLVLKDLISDAQYQTLFVSSTCILLSYPETWKYRCSAVLHECFANNIPCILSDISSFRTLERHFNYSPFFRRKGELIEAIERACSLPPAIAGAPYRDLELLDQAYEFVSESSAVATRGRR